MDDTPIWMPSQPEKSRMWAFMRFAERAYQTHFPDYQGLYDWSIKYPDHFWESIRQFLGIQFISPAKSILNKPASMLNTQWFSGATFNFAQQLLRRNDDHPALISVAENGKKTHISYADLHRKVAQCARALIKAGLQPGDRVAAILPNIPQTIIAMLASSAVGAIWSACSPDFGATAILDRFSQIEPKFVFLCDGYTYMGKPYSKINAMETLLQALPSIQQVVLCPYLEGTPIVKSPVPIQNWEDFIQDPATAFFAPLPFDHPLYILFSSGTTGKPKCIVHGAGGTLLQHLKELALHTDLKATDNLFFYTTCGWMMWNWMVSVLALGATLTLYEGSPGYPNTYRLFKLIEEEKITVFGTSAKFISTIEKTQTYPLKQYKMSHLRTILSTGSPLLSRHYDFIHTQIKPNLQISSISGGTDILSCFALGNPLLPVYKGELQCLGLGMAVEIYNEQGKAVEQERGELVCTQAFPSMPLGFWKDTQKIAYHKAYFEHFAEEIWAHGDFAEITIHKGLIIYGRSDTVLNPGGVRIGTAEIYRQVETIPEILESVVIGQEWKSDTRIVLFVRLQEHIILTKTLQDKIRTVLRQNASPRHVPAKILQVPDIPRTMNGKIVEMAIKQVVHGLPINNESILANPESLIYYTNREELQS